MTRDKREDDMVKRGVATRGRVAKIVAGSDAVEIKATIPNWQVKPALRRCGLNASNNDERYIYFFDTPRLDLFRAGVIARARRRVGAQHDSTVKFRPVDPEQIPKRWRKYKGFKIEADASEKGVITSGSLTIPVPKGLIKKVAKGHEPIGLLFDDEQQLFLLSLASQKFEFDRVVTMGPTRSWRWKIVHPELPWPLTVELWRRQDGEQMVEVSIKVPVAQAAAAGAGFLAFLAEVGAERDDAQDAKTRWTLSYYANKLAKAARPKKKKAGTRARAKQ